MENQDESLALKDQGMWTLLFRSMSHIKRQTPKQMEKNIHSNIFLRDLDEVFYEVAEGTRD